MIFQSARLGNSYYLPFQFNVCLNLSPFSFQQLLYIKYTTRLKKFISSKLNFKNIYIMIRDSLLSSALLTFMETVIWPFRAGSLRSPTSNFLTSQFDQSSKRLNQSFDFTSKNYFSLSPRKNVSQDKFLKFVLPSIAWRFYCEFYAKTSKINCAFTSPGGLLFNCHSWIFYMLYYNSRAFLWFNNSSKIPCAKPWFFLQSFAEFHRLWKCWR